MIKTIFFRLPFVPPHDIENAFVELVSICPNIDIGCLFSDYILHTYTYFVYFHQQFGLKSRQKILGNTEYYNNYIKCVKLLI